MNIDWSAKVSFSIFLIYALVELLEILKPLESWVTLGELGNPWRVG